MNNRYHILVAVLLLVLNVACLAEADNVTSHPPKTNVEVAAMFASPDIQPYTEADGDKEMLDSIWIYYTNGTFEQFADVDNSALLFSTGTYELLNEADFVYDNSDASNGQIIIRREKKLNVNGLEDYQSEHTYDLGTLGFTQLYAPNHDRKVAAVFYGCDKQPHLGSDGDQKNLDTWWIYYTDGTFEQFAIMDDDPADRVVLFSEGEYQLREGSSFAYEHAGEADYITIHRTKKYTQGGLTSYDSIHEYELGTLGFVRIVVIDP